MSSRRAPNADAAGQQDQGRRGQSAARARASAAGQERPFDAELAARAALSGTAKALPKRTSGIVESIRQLGVARGGALKARTAALQQLDDLLITAPEQLRSELRRGRTLKARGALCLQLRPDRRRLHEPLQAAKLALRSLARRVRELDRELGELDRQLEQLVAAAAPQTIKLFGVGTQGASQLFVTAGENIERLKSEAAFVKICGASPIPAPAARPATGSTSAATGKQTAPCT